MRGETNRTVACANCCSTLGYVSDQSTYRLYKHLLDCGGPDGDVERSPFSDHSCGSFLAREMVRYAESDAVFTFVVGLSDESHWTRTNAPSQLIFLRILSWDTLLSTVEGTIENHSGGDDESRILRFQRVVKVIFEVASNEQDPQLRWRTATIRWNGGGGAPTSAVPRKPNCPNRQISRAAQAHWKGVHRDPRLPRSESSSRSENGPN